MPFVLIIIGAIMVVSGIRDTQNDLGRQVAQDFTGSNNFTYWFLSIFIIGLIGYVPGFDKFSKTFIALIVVLMFLRNGGFFSKLNTAVTHSQLPSTSSNSSSQSSSLGSFGSLLNNGSGLTSGLSVSGSGLGGLDAGY